MTRKPKAPGHRPAEVHHFPVFVDRPTIDWTTAAYCFALGMLFAVWYIRAGSE